MKKISKLINHEDYPKYVISTDEYDFSRDGIIHPNIIDFLNAISNENFRMYFNE